MDKYYQEIIKALMKTVISGCEAVNELLKEIESLQNQIECLENQLAKALKENE